MRGEHDFSSIQEFGILSQQLCRPAQENDMCQQGGYHERACVKKIGTYMRTRSQGKGLDGS